MLTPGTLTVSSEQVWMVYSCEDSVQEDASSYFTKLYNYYYYLLIMTQNSVCVSECVYVHSINEGPGVANIICLSQEQIWKGM